MSEVIVGLDIGTSTIRAVVAERLDSGVLQIVGVGSGESKGLRRGNVTNIEKTVAGIHQAIESAEMMSGIEITRCVVGLGGSQIEGSESSGVVAVTDKGKGNREIDEKDIQRVIDTAKAVAIPSDHKVIHVIPKAYTVDDQEGIRDPRNMIGVRITVNVHIITSSVTCVRNMLDCVKRANIQIEDFMYHGLAAVKSVLSEDERNLGSVLIDIGGGTTDVVVMHNGTPVLTASVPVGGIQVTSDLAQVKNLSMEMAEQIKCTDGCCWLPLIDRDEGVLISGQGSRNPMQISKKELTEIMEARMSEIFLMVKDKLDSDPKVHPNALDNIVLCGGGALLSGVVELASAVFETPSVHVGIPGTLGGLTGEYRSPDFAVVLGLILDQAERREKKPLQNKSDSEKGRVLSKIKKAWNNLF